MKSIVMYAPRDLRFEESETPTPEEDEALIKVVSVGVCGSDIPRINVYGAHVSPIIPGHEFSGEIIEINGDPEGFVIGDRVVIAPLVPCYQCKYCQMGEYSLCDNYSYYGSRTNGAFAQYVAVKKKNLLKIPDNVSYDCAATIDPLANALHGLKQAEFHSGDSVCVYGLGAIGLYMVQAARAMGASKIAAVDVIEEKLRIAMENGADEVFNGLDDDIARQAYSYFGGGADVTVDVTGSPIAQHNAILSTAKLGRMILLGISHQGLQLSEEAVDRIMRGQITMRGSWNSFSDPFPGWEWTEGISLMTEGKVNCDAVITYKLPLEDAPAIFESIYKKELYFNKILFKPWDKARIRVL
jgi:L-iditol 2-dehydrogenase